MAWRLVGGMALALACTSAYAQGLPSPAPAAPAESTAMGVPAAAADSPAGAASSNTPQLLPGGDILRLKNGTVLSGVQVLRKTPTDYEIEIVAGSVTLSIPRDQVKTVEYDDIEPLEMRSKAATAAGNKPPSEFPGQRLSPELSARLSADISDQPITYDNADLGTILVDLSKRTGIQIEVGQPVLDLPQDQRSWTYDTKPGKTTLFTLLRDDLPAKFANLEAVFLYDKIVITTREAAATLNAAQPEGSAEPAQTAGAASTGS